VVDGCNEVFKPVTWGVWESWKDGSEIGTDAFVDVQEMRFLPRSFPALSAADRQAIENKLGELKSRLERLGENF
jgi:hypothetical protein